MPVIHSYVRFNGNAKEAFTFYQKCLGGELTFTTVAESPMAQFMPTMQDKIFHAQLKKGDMVLLGSDMVGEEGLKKGNTMVLTLECRSPQEATALFEKLSEDGTVGHPITEQPYGAIGDLMDKFGVDWFIVYTPTM